MITKKALREELEKADDTNRMLKRRIESLTEEVAKLNRDCAMARDDLNRARKTAKEKTADAAATEMGYKDLTLKCLAGMRLLDDRMKHVGNQITELERENRQMRERMSGKAMELAGEIDKLEKGNAEENNYAG